MHLGRCMRPAFFPNRFPQEGQARSTFDLTQKSPLDRKTNAGELGLHLPNAHLGRSVSAIQDFPECVPAILAGCTTPQHVASAFGANFYAPSFQAVFAKRLLERRAEEACLLHLGVQVRHDFALIVDDRRTALRAKLSLVRVVPSANRAFNGEFRYRFLVATIAPRAACSAIRHSLPPNTQLSADYADGGFGAPGAFGAPGDAGLLSRP